MMQVAWAKLVHYHSFKKFLALHAGAVLLVVYVASSFTNVDIQGQAMPLADLFAGAHVWPTVSSLTHWLFYIPAFFTVQIVAAELELKLVRAQVIAGFERRSVVAGWVVQNAVLAVFGVLIAVLAGVVVGRFSGAELGLGVMLKSELGYGLYGLVLLNFAVLAATLLRRPVPSLVLLLLWPVVELLLGWMLEHNGYPAARDYLPFASMGTLAPWPGGSAVLDLTSPVTLAGVGYGVLAALLTGVRLGKLDL